MNKVIEILKSKLLLSFDHKPVKTHRLIQTMLKNVDKFFITVEEKQFFNTLLLKTLSDLAVATSVEPYFLSRNRDKGNVWNSNDNASSVNINFSEKLEEKADKNDFYRLYEKDLSQLNIEAFPIVKKGLAFQFFNDYDYLILVNSNSEGNQNYFEIICGLVSEIKNKLSVFKELNRLKNDLYTHKSALSQNEIKLRETERSLKKRIYEFNNLLEISSELYSILDFNQLINSALLTIVGQLGCQRSFALLYDARQNSYSRCFTKGFSRKEDKSLELAIDHPLVETMLKHQQPLRTKELDHQEKLIELREHFKNNSIELIAPIVQSNRLRGFIGCGAKLYENEFDTTDIQLFTLLVNIIAISISNAQMYEDVKKMSFTDAMTNLNNYRYFENRLKEELNRARRSGDNVSLLMLDIDYFKNYNDNLGHQAGDEALRVLGWILKNTVRDEDIVSRYGGEEFGIILPGMEKTIIPVLAERLRSRVEEHPFFKESVQPEKRITVSIGGSSFPEDAKGFGDLVEKADKALYEAKNNGRNKFILYKK